MDTRNILKLYVIYIYYITYNHCTEAVAARHITKKVQDDKDIKIIKKKNRCNNQSYCSLCVPRD